jgi:hypothetical protein
MKKISVLSLSILFAFALGCASAPAVIDDSLLADKTNDETQKIYALEDQIIKKNKELEEAKAVTEEADKALNTAKGDLTIAEKEGQIFDEKEKVAKANKDDNAIAEAQKSIRENKVKIGNLKIALNYRSADDYLQKARESVIGAELNTDTAELNYEKAKIARRYQDKKEKEANPDGKKKEEPGFFDKIFNTKDKNKIDVEEYSNNVESESNTLKVRNEDLKIAQKKLDEAKTSYDKIKK